MAQYFTLAELIRSDTARKRGIDNTPTWEVVEHLSELVASFLDPLRRAYGQPIRVSSGYRSPELNNAVHGAATSVHMIGYAADLQVGGSFPKFRDFAISWARANGIAFDQIIVESDSASGAKWLHVGLFSNAGEQRRQVKTMTV